MRKHFMRGLTVVLLIAITLLGMNLYSENKTNTAKKEVKDYYNGTPFKDNLVTGVVGVHKVDENNNPLGGVTFKLRSFNDSFEYTLHHSGYAPKVAADSGFYYVQDYDDFLSQSEVESALSDIQINLIHSVRKAEDLGTLFGDYGFCLIDTEPYHKATIAEQGIEPEPETVLFENNIQQPDCIAALPTVYSLEETKVPTGYAKKKVLIPGIVTAYYSYPEGVNYDEVDGNTPIQLSAININSLANGYYMEYGEVSVEELTGADFSEALRLWKRYGIKNSLCGTSLGDITNDTEMPLQKIAKSGAIGNDFFNFVETNRCEIYLENEKGEVRLEVTSYVNNKESITTDINEVIEYKVEVKNIGTADAVDSIVTAKVPQGFVYVEGSVSKNGVYKDGVITWKVDRIDRGTTEGLTFQAYAPKGVNAYSSYVGEASVENYAVEGNKVDSNKTYVKLSLNNPYTYAPIGMIIIVLLFVGLVLGIGLSRHCKQK